uniref:Uncharacterized protein n=1 Tax=Rhizophora mucronata TaxID=61149 RepID=A0A2P2KP04_RHIMU
MPEKRKWLFGQRTSDFLSCLGMSQPCKGKKKKKK